MEKVLVWGCGGKTHDIFMRLNEQFFENYIQNNILGFIDSDPDKQNIKFKEYEIFEPNAIKRLQWDKIAVSTIYFKEVFDILTDKYHVDKDRIISFDEYIRNQYCMYQHDLNCQKQANYNTCQKFKKFNFDSTVVYTAIFNDYDSLKEPLFIDEKWHYKCFTDNPNLKSKIWEIIPIDAENVEGVQKDRHIKLLPHEYLDGYETSIWIDANIRIAGDLREYMNLYQKQSDLLVFPHFERDCIYDEGAACICTKKGDKLKILSQLYHYKEKGYPLNNGLFCGGILIRNHNECHIKTIMEQWCDEIAKFSHRDQISLPYVLWKNEYYVDCSDADILNNKWIRYESHSDKLFSKH